MTIIEVSIMAVSGKVSFKCDQCGTNHTLEGDAFNFQVAAVVQRDKGEETHYIYDYEADCIKCGKRIDIDFEIWEYPKGTLHDTSYTLSGASDVKEEFHIGQPME